MKSSLYRCSSYTGMAVHPGAISGSTADWIIVLVARILPFALAFAALPARAQTSAPDVAIVGSPRLVVQPGGSFTLTAVASGTGSVTYRWYRANRLVVGETKATFMRTNVSGADSGAYTVMATDAVGSRLSEAAFVLVAPEATRCVAWSNSAALQDMMIRGWTRLVGLSCGYRADVGVFADGSADCLCDPSDPIKGTLKAMSDVVAAAAGIYHVLALRADGTVAGAGDNSQGQIAIPPGLSHVVAIASGSWHSLALKCDGRVVAWGDNRFGQTDVPSGLSNVVAIAAGETFSLALKSDGTVVGWGNRDPGDAGRWINVPADNGVPGIFWTFPATSGSLYVPEDLGHVVAISANASEALALLDDGTVYGWGPDQQGSGGLKPGLGQVVEVAAGSLRSLAILADGSAVSWGNSAGGGAELVPLSTISKAVMGSASSKGFIVVRDAGEDAMPSISAQPWSSTVDTGGSLRLSVGVPQELPQFYVPGVTPLDFQWFKDGAAIPGATAQSLDFSAISEDDAGTYTVTVSSATGVVTSVPAVLTVVGVNHFAAVSTLCRVGVGDSAAVQSFVLKAGAVVLVRAVGPTLTAFGLGDVLLKPRLVLYDGRGNAIAGNYPLIEPMMGSPNATSSYEILTDIQGIGASAHAFPLSSADDAAVAVRLPAGVYSVQVSSPNQMPGRALLEIYVAPEAVASDRERVIAASTRCVAGSGDSAAVFGLSMNKAAQVLIRAVGPSLGTFGVQGPLMKPRLILMDESGNPIASNAGWQVDANQGYAISNAAAAVGDFPLTSAGDAALLVTLPGGQYTARVESADGSTGVVLIEAYLVAPAK